LISDSKSLAVFSSVYESTALILPVKVVLGRYDMDLHCSSHKSDFGTFMMMI